MRNGKTIRLAALAALTAFAWALPAAASAQCAGNLTDAVGDTVVLNEGDSLMEAGFVDVVDAWVRPADDYPATELGVRFAEPLPYYPPANFNAFFFFDKDGDLSNNDDSGTRAGSDSAYSLMFGEERRQWHTVTWSFDSETGEWTPVESPEVLFAFDYGGIIIHVPFEQMPEGATWPWRVTAAAASGDESAKDSYPDKEPDLVVCPDGQEEPVVISGTPKQSGGSDGTATPGQSTDGEGLPWWVYLWAILLLAGLIGMVMKGFRERKKGGGMTVTEPPALTPEGKPVGEPPGSDPGEWSQPEEPPPGEEKPGSDPGEWSQPEEPPPGEESPTEGQTSEPSVPEIDRSGGRTVPEEPPGPKTVSGPTGGGETPLAGDSTPKVAKGGGENPPETPPEQPVPPETPPSAPDGERNDCRCPKCRLYITIGRQSDKAIGSAMNLGKAIKRETAAADDIDEDDRCVKVAHFSNSGMTRGRYVTRGEDGDLDWARFSGRQVTTADRWGDICLWKEVMLVHHGESRSRVRRILQGLRELIPEKPIQRLVLYYCGGEGTLPEPEFRALASDLGRRLKQVPEECRPSQVDIYLAPTINFGGKEHFTKLVIQQSGLISYEGKMKHYSVDENGNITEHGNQSPPGGQLFGDVPLGRLGSNPNLDAEAYRDHWREIARLPLSDIKRYRQRIEEAGLDSPAQTPRERQEQAYRDLLGEERAGQISADEWDELVDIRSRRKAGQWLKQKFGDTIR